MTGNCCLLHVIDNEKFKPFCIKTFGLIGLENEFCSTDEFSRLSEKGNYDIIVLHCLSVKKARIINHTELGAPLIWFFWGADAFRLGKFYNRFLMPRTKLLRIQMDFKKSANAGFRTVLKTLKPGVIDTRKVCAELIQAFKKVDIIVPVVPGDYELLKQAYEVDAEMFHLNYVNPIFNGSPPKTVKGADILLGNSAFYSNNHLEILDRLSKLELGERKVFIPLSYGNEAYAAHISHYARKKLPHNAIALTDFLDFEAYQEILLSCSIVIMNHLRQQAMGNIVQALLNGAHLYLNKSSTVYSYLKQQDFLISDIADIARLRNLTPDEREHNRERCIEVFGPERQKQRVEGLLRKAISVNRQTVNYECRIMN